MNIVNGNLLDSKVDVIVQQTNCVTMLAHGLSYSIKEKYPYADLYKFRKSITRNKCTIETQGVPGTSVLLKPDNSFEGPVVANLMGQICPGKPSIKWCKIYNIDYNLDTTNMRLKYFEKSLESLLSILSISEYKTIGFPYMIGCGMAGGNWNNYKKILERFAEKLNEHDIKCIFYKL